jgi:RimJ/RimL family protein N-acetyltransferase
MGTPSPTFPILTARLSLRPYQAVDLDDLYEYHALPEVARYLYTQPRSREETQAMLERKMAYTGFTADTPCLALVAVLQETGKLIGEVSLVWASQEHQQGEIGFVFNPAYHGQGFASEATRVMLKVGFGTYALHRIFGRCDARNTASARLMERLGMRREAHFIHNEFFKGEWGDELVYAILADEWKQAAGA